MTVPTTSTEVISRHAADRRFRYASAGAAWLFGRPLADLRGRPLEQVAQREDRASVVAWFEAVGSGAPAEPVTYRVRGRDRSQRWVETSGEVNPKGEVRCTSRDVTRLKRIELQIEKVAIEWRATFDSASDLIMMLSPDSRIVRANKATAAFLGLGFPDILGRTFAELMGEEAVSPHVNSLAQTPRRLADELYLPGRKQWFASTLDPIRRPGGEVTGAVHILRDITDRKRAQRELRASRDALRRLASHLQSARESERAAIAREVHDELGHGLTALKMEIAQVARRLQEPESGIRASLQSINGLIEEAIATVRRIATELRPGVLDDLGLAAAIEWQAGEFQRRTGIATRVEAGGEEVALAGEGSTAVFRIFQEAMTNVARHAGASHVDVSLSRRGRAVVLTVADDGRGFTPRAARDRTAHGLVGMQERAQMIGGQLRVKSDRGRGTTVTLRIPS